MIAVASKLFGYSPRTASYISLTASLVAVVVVFLVGKVVDPSGISGLAAALIFSVTPVFAVHGVGTYAEPVSNLLMLAALLMCLCLLGPSTLDSQPLLLICWTALTFTAILAIAVKRENLLIVPVVLLAKVMFQTDCDSIDAPKRRLQYLASLLTILFCAGFALNQLRLVAVIHREQLEYSQFPFNLHVWLTMLPMFLRGYFTWSWYFGSALLFLGGAFWSIKSRRPGALVVALFTAYLLLYTSHVRSYYQVHGGTVTEMDSLRYSMNIAGLWAIMAGVGLSTLIKGLCQIGFGFSGTRRVRRILWVCAVGYTLCTWFATDRLKEDMVANETTARLRPAEAALQALHRSGNPDTFLISVEPLLIQMLANEPVNVIDFKDLNSDLLEQLRSENPGATFFYLEQDVHKSAADHERYYSSFEALERTSKTLLARGDDYAVFEILESCNGQSSTPRSLFCQVPRCDE